MYKVMKTFICRGCVNAVTSTGCPSADIGVNANLELVDKFCFLADVLSVDGDADAAVENRIRIGWNKFRHCLQIRIYRSHVRSSMLHGSETWPVRTENEVALEGQG